MTLAAEDVLPACPGCGGATLRARLAVHRPGGSGTRAPEGDARGPRRAWWPRSATPSRAPAQYLAWREGDDVRVVPLEREWTRIGRSLAADVRFDDPTVSRRHALIVRQPDGVRVLDDRSLNGVFVNGERVEWRVLTDGDEIVVGRYRLHFVDGRAARHARRRRPLEAAG